MRDLPLPKPGLPAAPTSLFQRLIDGSDGMLVTAPTLGGVGAILFANPAFLEGSGYGLADIVGRPATLFDPPFGQRGKAEILLSDALATADGSPHAVMLRTRDGRARLVEARCRRVPAEDGTRQHRAVFLRPADATQPAPASSRESETVAHILASVFTIVDTGLGLLDEQGRYVMANRAAAQIVGLSVDQMVGRSFAEFLPPEDRGGALERNAQAFAGGRSDQRSVTILRTNGERIPAEIASLVVAGGDGRRFRVLSVRSVGDPSADLGMQFEHTLRQRLAALAGDRVLVSGRLRLIGLDAVRRRFGPRWDAIAVKAREVAAGIIRHRLAAEDVFAPTDQNGFVICFGTLGEREAEFKANALRQEIFERLVGELDDPEAARVSVEVAPVPVPDAADDPSVSLVDIICGHLQEEREALEQRARAALDAAFDTQEIEAFPVITASGETAFALAHLPFPLLATVQRARAALADNEAFARDIDLLVLGLVAHKLADSESEPVHIVPVSYGTFAARRLSEGYLRICRSMALSVRQRLLFELREVPVAAAQSHLAEIFGLLTPFARGIVLELPVADEGWLDWSRLQPRLLSIPAEALLTGGERGTERMQRLARGAHVHQARLLVLGVSASAPLAPLWEAGVDFATLRPRRGA